MSFEGSSLRSISPESKTTCGGVSPNNKPYENTFLQSVSDGKNREGPGIGNSLCICRVYCNAKYRTLRNASNLRRRKPSVSRHRLRMQAISGEKKPCLERGSHCVPKKKYGRIDLQFQRARLSSSYWRHVRGLVA